LAERLEGEWTAIRGWGLLADGLVLIAAGLAAIQQITIPAVAASTTAVYLYGGGGAATLLAGVLLVFRQRVQTAERIVTVLAGATFAFALAFLPDRDAIGESMLQMALLFAGALAAAIVFAPPDS
jgi:hypothetical protein